MEKKKVIRVICIIAIKNSKKISKFVKNDGILVYATCSLENEENWDVVSQFLKLITAFYDSPIGLIPNEWINDKIVCKQFLISIRLIVCLQLDCKK